MSATAFTLTALVIAASATPVIAAPSARMAAMKSKMAEMQARNPQGFAACQALAKSRGYQLGQTNDYDYVGLMGFIDGCLMGAQH